MERFDEELDPLPLEVVNAQTIAEDLAAWKANPPDKDFKLILEAEAIDT